MDRDAALEYLKAIAGEDADEALLSVLFNRAEAEFLSITRQKEVPAAAWYVVADMAQVKHNRLGEEGLSGTNLSGISESYINGYPAELVAAIYKFRRVRFV